MTQRNTTSKGYFVEHIMGITQSLLTSAHNRKGSLPLRSNSYFLPGGRSKRFFFGFKGTDSGVSERQTELSGW